MSLKQSVARSSMWSAFQEIGNQLTSFLVFIALTRVLDPAEIGLVALAASFVEVTAPLMRAGFPEALIQRRQFSGTEADTCFWSSIVFSGVAALGIVLLSPAIADAFGMPGLSPVLQVLAITLPLSALSATHEALMTRSFGFKSLALRSLIGNIAGGAVGLAAAIYGFGIWSLVIQRIVTSLVSVVAIWLSYRWVPKLRFSIDEFLRMGRFGVYMMGSSFLSSLNGRVTDFVLGFFLGAQSVGYVRVAGRSVNMVTQLAMSPFTSVALPTFSRLQDDRAAFERAVVRMIQVCGIVALPAYFGLAALAIDLVPFAFGQQWAVSGPLLAILCFNAIPIVMQYFTWPALAAVGYSEKATLGIAVIVASSVAFTAAAAPFGLTAVVIANVARSYLTLPLSLWLLRRYAHVRISRICLAMVKPLAMALTMGAATYFLRFWLMDLAVVTRIATLIVAGAVIYGGLMLVFGRDLLMEILAIVRKR